MLSSLHVSNFGVIEDLSIELMPGMTVITGETGAGKTLIVEALNAIVSAKSSTHQIRSSAESALIEATFLDPDFYLARVIAKNSRGRSYVDQELVPQPELFKKGSELIELYGQHGQLGLLQPAKQRDALDLYGNIDLTKLAKTKKAISSIRKEIDRYGGSSKVLENEVDYLNEAISRIEKLDIQGPDEIEKLKEKEEFLAKSVEILECLYEAKTLVLGTEYSSSSAKDAVSKSVNILLNNRVGQLDPLIELLNQISLIMEEVSLEIRKLEQIVEADPDELRSTQERRHALSDLIRLYGGSLGDVLEFKKESQNKVDRLINSTGNLEKLQEELNALILEKELLEQEIGKARRVSAQSLSREVTERLRELALPNAEISIELDDSPSCEGVCFNFRANPGMEMAPINKIASGGELSRAMLALRLVLSPSIGNVIDSKILIFDEVDAGVGGNAAVYIGKALYELSRGRQILVVTHLAQVAAFCDQHIVIEKTSDSDSSVTNARELSGKERLIELSRMLSGLKGSKSGVKHAQDLLEEASKIKESDGKVSALF
ncbi:MAG: AAA family ATPase [Acidimicrobiales bacterium]|nr:AAA family ATPase [Acidimicrobiales bacterium]